MALVWNNNFKTAAGTFHRRPVASNFGLMQRTDSLEKTLMLGKTEGRRRRGQQDGMVGWHYRLDGHEFE